MAVIQPRTQDMVDLTPLDPGTYKGRITSVTEGESKAGNPKIVVKFAVTTADGKTRPRTAHIATTGEGAWNFDQLLRACHMENIANQLKAGEDIPFDTDALLEQELNLVMDHQLYQGQTRDQITSYLKA